MIEDVVKKIRLLLVNYLPYKLDEQDTLYAGESDAFILNDVADDDIHIGEGRFKQNTPFIVLSPDSTTDIVWHMNQPSEMIHNIRITYVETDTETYRLQRRVMRAGRAIENVLETTQQYWANVFVLMTVDEIEYTTKYEHPDKSDTYKECTLNVSVMEHILFDDEYDTIFPWNRMKTDTDADDNPTYIGYNVLQKATDNDPRWYIWKQDFTNNKLIEQQCLMGTWTGRAALSWDF